MITHLTLRRTSLLLAALLTACGGGGGGGGSNQATGASGNNVQQQSALPEVSWYSAAQPLMDRYCVSCHHSGSDLAPFALESFEQVEAKRSAMIYVLESDAMPPFGYADLAANESQLLMDWLKDGAPIGDASQAPLREVVGGFSYHGDVRAIIEKHCVNCHEEGGIAPFTLESFEQVKSVAAAAVHAIEQGTMPPWPPTPGYTAFEHERLLAPEEKHVLMSFLQGEMPEGDPADYRAPNIQSVPPGVFNLRLKLSQAYTPTLRPDDHRCFAIEWPLEEDSYVTDVGVLPDQLDVVHHVIVSIAEPEDAHHYYAADGQDGRPGWYCLGAGGVRGAPLPRQIGGWVPGAGREPTPEGTGIGVRPGSIMVVQMHYNTLVAEPKPDQSTILVTTTEQVERPSVAFLVTNPGFLGQGGMPIPAGDPDVHHEVILPGPALAAVFGSDAGVTHSDPWVLHNGFLHMHNLGKSGRITLQRYQGPEQVLLDVRDWDFNWQGTYRFEREVLIGPRDRIKLECNWDNSQENQPFVNGEQLPAQHVEWGDGTQDEMCLMSVLMTQPLPDYDYSYSPTLHIESPTYRQRFAPGDLVPLRLILNNFSLHDPGDHNNADPNQHASGEHDAIADNHSQVYKGHYHVYLDTDDDGSEHLTAWDDNYYFQLPDNIEPGEHKLRVNLRDNEHHGLGIEQSVLFEVVESTTSVSANLIEVQDWAVQSAAQDSLAAHRPEDFECPDDSWYEEDGALEVETGFCEYLSLAQPSKTAIERGDQLHLVLWHGDLVFEQAVKAHVAIVINGRKVWDAWVDIPTEADIYDVRVPLNFDAPVGSIVEYHLHNHGYNTWTLLQLEIER
jgi:hypothetical protein